MHFTIVKHSGNDKPNSKNFKSERNGTQMSVALDMLNGATTYEVTVQGETEAGKGNMSTNKAILETNARRKYNLLSIAITKTNNGCSSIR